jgi:hypothetical protein
MTGAALVTRSIVTPRVDCGKGKQVNTVLRLKGPAYGTEQWQPQADV